MELIPVKSPADKKEFLLLPVEIYKNDPQWIRPLDNDIEKVFDPKQNKFFRHGEAERWLLKRDGKTIGRVAAFINRKTAKTYDVPTGGMGFFECINDKDAAFLLFDTCKNWLKERGMEAMDGPVNFGERDQWWGLMIEPIRPATYCMNYNPAYYRSFFEEYGFREFFQQYVFAMPVMSTLPQTYQEKADRIAKNPKYHFEHIRKANLEKYAEDFRTVYNKAWVKHEGVKGMPKAQAMSLMKKIKPILDEKILWFAYYDKEAVGFFLILPEINQVVRKLNGRFDWWGKLKFLYYKKRGVIRKMFGVAFGIVPEHQGKGLEGALVVASANVIQPLDRYDDFEMNWIGDFNPKMIHIAESIGAEVSKTYITYRYMFDPEAPFRRAQVID